MKKYFYTIMVLAFALQSCYSDKTTEDIHNISEIEIDLGEYDYETIEIDKNETLVIEPIIKQTVKDKAVSYEWEINQELYSTDNVFEYTGANLGTFLVRLKVSNEDGSSFKLFNLKVNSPYEEGLLILSEDDARNGSLGFIKTLPGKSIVDTNPNEVEVNAFQLNNDGETLAKGVTDLVKRGSQFFISSEIDAGITIINGQTLEEEARIEAPEFPDFKPFRLNIPDNSAMSAMVLTREGKVFDLATKEHLVLNNSAFDESVNLEPKTQCIGGMNFTMNYFWDNNASRLWNIWYINTNTKDELKNHDLGTFFGANNKTYTLTIDRESGEYVRTVFGPYIQEFFDDPLEILEKDIFVANGPTPKRNSVTLLREDLHKLLYVEDNNIYQWYYSGHDFSGAPLVTIDIQGEITWLEHNPNGKELFVGVYDDSKAGKKGSVLVYNIETGKKLGQFLEVADKPVKMLYKNKQ